MLLCRWKPLLIVLSVVQSLNTFIPKGVMVQKGFWSRSEGHTPGASQHQKAQSQTQDGYESFQLALGQDCPQRRSPTGLHQLSSRNTRWKIYIVLLCFENKFQQVNGRTDRDLCEKSFNKKTDFSYGVFSIGCACKLNITLGFELMLNKESAHNLFR